MAQSLQRLFGLFWILTFVWLSGPTPEAAAETICREYSNSSIQYFNGCCFVCAGSGGTCRECTTLGGGGYTTCLRDYRMLICIDHQDWQPGW